MEKIDSIFQKALFPVYVLSVSHSDYRVSLGGTEKVLHEEQLEFKRLNISYIQLYPVTRSIDFADVGFSDQLVGMNIDSVPAGTYPVSQLGLLLQVASARAAIRPLAVHIHHMMNFSIPGLTFLIWSARCSIVRFFLHDYYSICTDFNLLKNGKEYCGERSSESGFCETCQRHDRRERHREGVLAFLKATFPQIISPSSVAADIWARYYPQFAADIRVVPHQLVTPTVQNGCRDSDFLNGEPYRPKIAYIGYEAVCKGLESWWRLAKDEEIQRRYQLFHLGAAGAQLPGVTYIPVSFLADGPAAMVEALLKHEIDIAFLWSIWPETYSFTLFESLAANCYVITNRLSGNIAANIGKGGRGAIFDTERDLFDYLYDVRRVKTDFCRCFKENGTAALIFNPQIALETARFADGCVSAPHPIWPDSLLSSWRFLLSRLDCRDTTPVESEDPLKELTSLRSKIAVYELSRFHRGVEYLRTRFSEDSFWGAIARRILFGVPGRVRQWFRRQRGE